MTGSYLASTTRLYDPPCPPSLSLEPYTVVLERVRDRERDGISQSLIRVLVLLLELKVREAKVELLSLLL